MIADVLNSSNPCTLPFETMPMEKQQYSHDASAATSHTSSSSSGGTNFPSFSATSASFSHYCMDDDTPDIVPATNTLGILSDFFATELGGEIGESSYSSEGIFFKTSLYSTGTHW
jgi:hypothetical protein